MDKKDTPNQIVKNGNNGIMIPETATQAMQTSKRITIPHKSMIKTM